MRTILSVGVLALFATIAPAQAQMCGGAQQAQASTPAQGGMCGVGQATADDPMADNSAQKPQTRGMCPCCRNMAMMKGGMGGMDGMKGHDMPGMEMPKQ